MQFPLDPKPAENSAKIRRDHVRADEIKGDPLLLLFAKNNLTGGAMRVYFLSKFLDEPGSGYVGQDELFAMLSKLGVSVRNRQRWVKRATELKILIPKKLKKGKVAIFSLVSYARAAVAIDCPSLARSPAAIPIKSLFSRKWRPSVWVAYLSTLGDDVSISRAELERRTGVSQRAQIYYDKEMGIVRVAQYAMDGELSQDHLEGIRENIHPHAFVMTQGDGRKNIAWQLPNRYTVPENIARSLAQGQYRYQAAKLTKLASSGRSFEMAKKGETLRASPRTSRLNCRRYHTTEKRAQRAFNYAKRQNPDGSLDAPLLILMANPKEKLCQFKGFNRFWKVYRVV